jgi:multicomponent Na+:H+ antiporter subunit C
MEILLPLIVGVLYTAGIYLLLRRSMVKVIIGLGLMAHAANLLIFTVGRLTRGHPPLIDQGSKALTEPFADPLPQALILTAIVISFGVQAFAIILFKKAYQTVGTDDLDDMITTDSLK